MLWCIYSQEMQYKYTCKVFRCDTHDAYLKYIFLVYRKIPYLYSIFKPMTKLTTHNQIGSVINNFSIFFYLIFIEIENPVCIAEESFIYI